MNNLSQCKCGHLLGDHDPNIGANLCLVGWGRDHTPGCECEGFVPDNLTMLEEKYEQSKEI